MKASKVINGVYYLFIASIPYDSINYFYSDYAVLTPSKVLGYLLITAIIFLKPNLLIHRPLALFLFTTYIAFYLLSAIINPAQNSSYVLAPLLTWAQMF